MYITANTLPEDILYAIFRFAVDSSPLYINAWRYQLRLLAVCSRWRALLAPKVYAHMFVCYNSYRLSAAHAHGSPPTDSTQPTSNVSLYASCPGLIRRVRHISIHISDNCQRLTQLNQAIAKLALLQPQWQLASRLTLNITCLCCMDIAAQRIAEKLVEPADLLADILPNLQLLTLNTHSQCVQKAYMHLLARLERPMHGLSNPLTRLISTCTSQEAVQLPTNLAQTLVYLELMDVSIDCMWVPAEFKQLKHLSVGFSEPETPSSFAVPAPVWPKQDKVGFPQLRRLRITNLHSYCSLLEVAKLPLQMEHVSTQGTARMAYVLDAVQLPVCSKSLTLAINSQQYSGILMASPSLNTVVHKLRPSNNVEFSTMNQLVDIPDVRVFAGPAITSLAIAAPVSCIGMLDLVLLMPNLATLTLKSLVWDDGADACMQINQQENSHCKLNTLDLTCKPKHRPHIYNAVTRLIPVIPTLKNILLCDLPIYI
ncbi:hypothetical protein EV183_004748 [Coemansia sp. RSA 2336]|nr:hypothetical protein EV183_004748 [Coemansia sp. RSA 2336]